MASFASFITQEKAQENIQALAETELQILDRKGLEKLYQSGFNWQETGRKLTEIEFVNLHKRMVLFKNYQVQNVTKNCIRITKNTYS